MGNVAVTLAERPELEEQAIADGDIWPEFNLHGDTYLRMWPRLSKDLPEYQFSMCDDRTGQVIAEAHTVPCWWDGTPAGLPGGIDDTIADAFDRLDNDKPVNTLCAVAAEIPTGGRGTGLAAEILRAMGIIAGRHGLTHMIAPVRPTWKDRYPITPIEQYMTWRRDDGSLQDPWLRLHERLGATIGPTAPPLTESKRQWRNGSRGSRWPSPAIRRCFRPFYWFQFGLRAARSEQAPPATCWARATAMSCSVRSGRPPASRCSLLRWRRG